MSAIAVDQKISAEDFKFAFRHHPAGVGIITADVGDGPVAMTVSSLASVGINPPSLVFSASPLSSSTQTICAAETVVVHLLASDQVELAKLGATSGVNRFGEGVNWSRLSTGEPYYPEANSWLRGRVVNRVDVSGSTLIVVEAIEAKPREENEDGEPAPLVYHNRKWFALGEHSALD
ncbi:flavin reductase family protein [Pseudarthrobacter sp. LMD1-1-1.1]|uniref:flavin reductase family protein n=1 Tax=Pseudarthrobacter sp. LMD1-1-1.1 TaxID=3135242 RepID=UPI0034465420